MSPRNPSHSKKKIIEAATCLFYEQGYRATTVDQVIEKSGVSKPTVYSHYPTKETLCVAYLQDMHQHELDLLRQSIRKQKTPELRFVALIKHVRERIIAAKYRGCGFFNMISEMADPGNAITVEAKVYVDAIRALVREVTIDLLESDPRFKNRDAQQFADWYYLIVAGTITASQEYQNTWPADRAVELVQSMLKE